MTAFAPTLSFFSLLLLLPGWWGWAPVRPDRLLTPADMVLVPGGTFQMGDVMGDQEHSDESLHTVTLSNFYIAKKELTFEEFNLFCHATNRKFFVANDQRPVVSVGWYDAVEYCNWRSTQEGLQAVYTIDKGTKDSNNRSNMDTKNWLVTMDLKANGYRLPTEAEWEYAARQGGQKVRFGNGKNQADPQEINFCANEEGKRDYSVIGNCEYFSKPVGSFAPNALGLYDMSGNVYEWCWDWYDRSYYSKSPVDNPTGPISGIIRVARGGSWGGHPVDIRTTNRSYSTPNGWVGTLGFRLARTAVSL